MHGLVATSKVVGWAAAAIEYLAPFPRWSTAACAAMVSFPVFGGTNWRIRA